MEQIAYGDSNGCSGSLPRAWPSQRLETRQSAEHHALQRPGRVKIEELGVWCSLNSIAVRIDALHVPIKPDGMKCCPSLVPHHRLHAAVSESDECHIISKMARNRTLERFRFDFFPSELVTIRLDDIVPRHLAEKTQVSGERYNISVLATGDAIFWIDIAKAESRRIFAVTFARIRGFNGPDMLSLIKFGLPKDHHPLSPPS